MWGGGVAALFCFVFRNSGANVETFFGLLFLSYFYFFIFYFSCFLTHTLPTDIPIFHARHKKGSAANQASGVLSAARRHAIFSATTSTAALSSDVEVAAYLAYRGHERERERRACHFA